MDKDCRYYERRGRAERAAAKNSPNVQARRVHQQLAEQYAMRARAEGEVSPSDDAISGLPNFTILG